MEVYLQKAIQMDNMDSFESLLKWYNLIGRFLNPIKDGHLFVRRDMTISSIQTTYLPEFYADAETKFVNDTLLIRTGINDKQSWRILYTINDRPASACLQDARLIRTLPPTHTATRWPQTNFSLLRHTTPHSLS